jgi:hypothetical protein
METCGEADPDGLPVAAAAAAEVAAAAAAGMPAAPRRVLDKKENISWTLRSPPPPRVDAVPKKIYTKGEKTIRAFQNADATRRLTDAALVLPTSRTGAVCAPPPLRCYNVRGVRTCETCAPFRPYHTVRDNDVSVAV